MLAESEDQAHLIEALDGVVRRLGGVSRYWRFDRMATVCRPGTGRVTASFAAVARHYDAGVKMSSRQRDGAVGDSWAIAERRAAEACLPPPAPAPRLRTSCCFIYALPGMRECAACPRGGR